MRRFVFGLVLVLMIVFCLGCQQSEDTLDPVSAVDSRGRRILNQTMMYHYIGGDSLATLPPSLWPVKLEVEDYSQQIDWISTGRLISYGGIFGVIPHIWDISNDVLDLTRQYSGSVGYANRLSLSDEEKMGRMIALESLYSRFTSDPAINTELAILKSELTGPSEDLSSDSEAVKAARLLSLNVLYEQIGRLPDASSDLVTRFNELFGTYDYSMISLSEEERVARMLSLGSVYVAIEANPSVASGFVKLATQMSGISSDLTNDSSVVKAARLLSFSRVFGAGDATVDSLWAIEQLSGTLDYSKVLQSEAEQMARMFALTNVFKQIPQTIETKERLIASALNLLGPTLPVQELSDSVKAARLIALVGAYRAISQMPESKAEVLDAVERLCGTIDYSVQVMSEKERIARMIAIREVYEAIGRHYPNSMDQIDLAIELFGPVDHPSTFSSEVKSARIFSFSKLYEGVARQPDASSDLIGAVTTLAGEIDYLTETMSEEEQIARMLSLGAVYQGLARQPFFREGMKQIALELGGSVGDTSAFSDRVEAARLVSLSEVYEAISRNRDASSDILNTFDDLSGRMDYSN